MEKELYFRTRRFERKVGEGEPRQVYWMAVATENGFSVLEVTDSAQSPNLLMRFLPEGGESSVVEILSENIGLEEALSFLDTKESEMVGRKNTSPVENKDTVGGWHYLSFADRHRVNFKSGFRASHPDLYHSMVDGRSPTTLEHLTLPINGPIFSNDKKGILLTPVYHSQFSDGWVLYARAVRLEDRWQVQEVQRQITTGLPPSAPPVERIRNLRGETGNFFSVIGTLSNWEDVQALTPGTRFFGPEGLSEEQKQKLQMLALRGSYFRVAAERESLVFDVFGRPHLSIRGVVRDEGVFPRLNPEKPEFPSLQRLLRYIESSGPQEDAPPPPKEEDTLSPDKISVALALYLDHFLVQSGLSIHKGRWEIQRLDTDWLQVTREFLRKLNIELPYPQASALTIAADFLTEQGKELSRAAAAMEMELGSWQQRLESDAEVHRNKMAKVQSEIAELEARSKALAEKLARQTAALEDLSRKTAEEKEKLESLQRQQEELKARTRDAAIKEAAAIAEQKARELRTAMIDFRNATLPQTEGDAEPFVSLRLEFGSLTMFTAIDLPCIFSNIPDKGIKVRIDTYKSASEKKPKKKYSSDVCNKIAEELCAPDHGAVLWVEGRRDDVARFAEAGGPLETGLKRKFPLYPNLSSEFLISVQVNEAAYEISNVPDALARVVRAYKPFSDNVIAARLAP